MSELAVRPVPSMITVVEGCNCGGLNMHLRTCSFWDLSSEQQIVNRDDALSRLDEWVAALNASACSCRGST